MVRVVTQQETRNYFCLLLCNKHFRDRNECVTIWKMRIYSLRPGFSHDKTIWNILYFKLSIAPTRNMFNAFSFNLFLHFSLPHFPNRRRRENFVTVAPWMFVQACRVLGKVPKILIVPFCSNAARFKYWCPCISLFCIFGLFETETLWTWPN